MLGVYKRIIMFNTLFVLDILRKIILKFQTKFVYLAVVLK